MTPKMQEAYEGSSSGEDDLEKESEEEVIKSQSEGEDDEGSDEEGSQCSPTACDFTIKPKNLTKSAEKDSKPTSKRPLEACKDDAKESRSKKKAKGVENVKDKVSSIPASGPGAIQRIWSEENELALLQGIIDYRNQKGSDPYADLKAFYDFVRGRLFSGVVDSQMYEKLRRLKSKFLKSQRQREDGRDSVFSNSHELERFELSEKVWGGGSKSKEVEQKPKVKSNNVEDSGKAKSSGLWNSNAKVSVVKGKKKMDDKVGMEKENTKKDEKGGSSVDGFADRVDMKTTDGKKRVDGSSEFLSKYPNLSGSFDVEMSFLKDNLHLIGKTKAEELEEGWIKLQLEQMELTSKRFSLLAKQTELVLDAMKKG